MRWKSAVRETDVGLGTVSRLNSFRSCRKGIPLGSRPRSRVLEAFVVWCERKSHQGLSQSHARAQVKGKTEPVDVFTIVEARDSNPDQELLIWLETYEEGIRKFRDRDFTQSKILFSRFLEFYPEDLLAKMYLERSLEYEQTPPDQEWNAVEVFEKK